MIPGINRSDKIFQKSKISINFKLTILETRNLSRVQIESHMKSEDFKHT